MVKASRAREHISGLKALVALGSVHCMLIGNTECGRAEFVPCGPALHQLQMECATTDAILLTSKLQLILVLRVDVTCGLNIIEHALDLNRILHSLPYTHCQQVHNYKEGADVRGSALDDRHGNRLRNAGNVRRRGTGK